MKTLKSIVAALVLVTLLGSCSKNKNDEEELFLPEPQFPMKELISNGYIEEVYTFLNKPVSLEMGYKFKTFKNGEITGISIRVPENDEYRVTLWDFETQEIIATAYINSSANFISSTEIDPISISSGKEYFVSINTNDYYNYKNPESIENIIFPVESGDVLLISYGVSIGQNQIFPQSFNTKSYLGIVDVKFTPNN